MSRIRVKDLEQSAVKNEIIMTDVNGQPIYYALSSPILVSPTISPIWHVYKNDGVTAWPDLSTSSSNNIIVESGCIVAPNGTYSYPIPTTGQGLPTSVSGSWGINLPGANTSSPNLFSSPTTVITNTVYTVNLFKQKTGFSIINSQLVVSTGNDSTMDSMSVSFLPAVYFGFSPLSELTANDIKALGNKMLQSDIYRNIPTVTSGNNYTYYCYPSTYGNIQNIVQNDSLPIVGAFNRLADVSMISDSGNTIMMAVYKSNALDAFTNAKLVFNPPIQTINPINFEISFRISDNPIGNEKPSGNYLADAALISRNPGDFFIVTGNIIQWKNTSITFDPIYGSFNFSGEVGGSTKYLNNGDYITIQYT